MNIRQKIRAGVIIALILLIGMIALLAGIYPIYLQVIQSLSLPFSAALTGYFGTEIVKNYNRKD